MDNIYTNIGKLQEQIDVREAQLRQAQEQLQGLYQGKRELYVQLQQAQAEAAKAEAAKAEEEKAATIPSSQLSVEAEVIVE